MRFSLMIALLVIGGCASQKLALAPPAGVDLSGRWKLNEADSDDPQRVVLSQNAATRGGTAGSGGQGGQGGRGQSRTGRSSDPGAQAPLGPVTPAMGVLSEGLRWPGKQMEIQQAAGVVTMTSLGTKQVYRPGAAARSQGGQNSQVAGERNTRALDRRDGPPAVCGWDDKTLVVQPENDDEERPSFEERYSLSDDGQRLFEVVAFTGGRSGGFTVSRVWDRVPPGVAPGQ